MCEAKLYYLLPDNMDSEQHKKFNEIIDKDFEEGGAIDLIDDGQEQIDAVLEWVHRMKKNNSWLIVQSDSLQEEQTLQMQVDELEANKQELIKSADTQRKEFWKMHQRELEEIKHQS